MSSAQAQRPKPHSNPFTAFLAALPRPSILLLVEVCFVVGVTAGISLLLGYGDVSIYMGLVALYVAMGVFGGTLRADLSVVALYVAGLVFFVAAPLLVATVSELAGALLLVLAVGACAIIPALGRRYGSVRLGLGLITVYAFGYEATRRPDVEHVIVGSFVALGVILLIRLCAALPDPNGPLRQAIANVLVDNSRTALETAAATWLRGPSTVWAGRALGGAVQYRAATWSMVERQQQVDATRSHALDAFAGDAAGMAAALASSLRARRAPDSGTDVAAEGLRELESSYPSLDPEDRNVAKTVVDGLRRVACASANRDQALVRNAGSIRRELILSSLRAALSLDSDYFRNALRSMITVAVSLLIIARANQPAFALPLLMGAYGVLQSTFAGSITEARRRTIGVIGGAGVATLVVATASPFAAGIISTIALIVAFAFISSSIAIFMGGLVVTLTIAIAPVVHVDPISYAIGYAVSVVIGAVLAVTVGFLTVPRQTLARRQRALARAVQATADALEAIGAVSVATQQSLMLRAFRTQQNTMFSTTGRKKSWDSEASAALGGLNLIGLALMLGLADRSVAVDRTLTSITKGLRGDGREALTETPPLGSKIGSDAIDQLLRADYYTLHSAIRKRRSEG